MSLRESTSEMLFSKEQHSPTSPAADVGIGVDLLREDGLNYAELDPGIVMAVRVLRRAGVETAWSCEGGTGHSYTVPTIVFRGDMTEVQRVVELARDAQLGPHSVMRRWNLANEQFPERPVEGNDLLGDWEITFQYKFPIDSTQAGVHVEQKRRAAERSARESGEIERRRKELLPRLLKLEPGLERLHRQVIAGGIDLNDLWLTYFSYILEPIVGINRQDDGDQLLFSNEAFDAALVGLYYAVPIGQVEHLRTSVATTGPVGVGEDMSRRSVDGK